MDAELIFAAISVLSLAGITTYGLMAAWSKGWYCLLAALVLSALTAALSLLIQEGAHNGLFFVAAALGFICTLCACLIPQRTNYKTLVS